MYFFKWVISLCDKHSFVWFKYDKEQHDMQLLYVL